MARLFGTDGVRGLANREVTAELALSLSVAAAHELAERGTFGGHRPRALVCRDGRASGEFLGAATAAGLASAGVDVWDLGVLPTPAVAYLTADLEADLAAMLSASHNAMPDNGIKFFAAGGFKLDDAIEDGIEARLGQEWERPTGEGVGRVTDFPEGAERYIGHLVDALPNRLDGVKVALDTANGAASHVAPEAFRRAGAEVVVMADQPDGLNINDGVGSTHLKALQDFVVAQGADMGLAFDGDADRCLAVDGNGNQVDGDQIMAILALAMREQGTLANNTLVATVMSNLGLFKAMEEQGVTVLQTAVGDRYVLEEMRRGGHVLGGEQSGHVIMLEHGTTGDGTLTGLMLTARVAATGKSLVELAQVVTPMPQVLVNVKGVDKNRVDEDAQVQAEARAVSDELGADGRVLLRKSGTEPLVRVMVEADTQERAQQCADRIAAVVAQRLAL